MSPSFAPSLRSIPATAAEAFQQALLVDGVWVQPNGELRDMGAAPSCSSSESGPSALPPKRFEPPNPLAVRQRPEAPSTDQTPVEAPLSRLSKLQFVQVRRGPLENLFNSPIEYHHHLGYSQPVGEHLKYLVLMAERPIACFSWSSAPRHIGCRDRLSAGAPSSARPAASCSV